MGHVSLQVGNKLATVPLDLAMIRVIHLDIIQGIWFTDQGGIRQPFWRCLLRDWLHVHFIVCFCQLVLLSRRDLTLPGLLALMLPFIQGVLADLSAALVVGVGAHVC